MGISALKGRMALYLDKMPKITLNNTLGNKDVKIWGLTNRA